MKQCHSEDAKAGIVSLKDFDYKSGLLLERFFFNYRLIVILCCILVTLVLGFQATKLRFNAGFEKMIPAKHPYIVNYLAHRDELVGLGNAIRVAVEITDGIIFNEDYLEIIKQINDEIFFIPGVDRVWMKSLWTPTVRWTAITEEGMDGGPVMPDNYDGSPESMAILKTNIERSGQIGQLVANNYKSSIIHVPLLDFDYTTGASLDYSRFSQNLEVIRDKYQRDNIRIHITGFAKIVGDLIEGLHQILVFFAVAVIIAALILYNYTRCVRSTLLVVLCSLLAVVWQMGLLATFGFELDPYAILVPFLVFSIGMSHGSQKMNGIVLDIGRGSHKLVAARMTFRRLFIPGLTALLSDAVGFGVLMIIQIQVIHDLAVAASIGVFVLIFTNLVLIPIMLSYIGVSEKAAKRAISNEAAERRGEKKNPVWKFLDLFTRKNWAIAAILICTILGIIGLGISSNLKIGDLDPGAPELRPDSRYNQDNAFITKNYTTGSDVLVVMVQTPPYGGPLYRTQMTMDSLEWQLQQLPGVENTQSLAGLSRYGICGMNEGNFEWYELIPNQSMLNAITSRAPRELFNKDYSLLSLFVFCKDHKADTLTTVVEKVEAFAAENNSENLKFLLAAGTSGIEAATNIVVKKAMREMLYYVYGAVILLCYITFRSWRAVVVAVFPLVLTSILCEVLMVWMGIGVKVATLPVIALGVGIGVDYALYVLSVTIDWLRTGKSLAEAYYEALRFTGKVVVLIGITLSLGVATWAFSPIKFQADMGILLTFMFLWNMIGALILLPALGYFLLKTKKV